MCQASCSIVNSSIYSEKTCSRLIFHLSPSHFVHFLTAQEKQNRPLTELNCPQGGPSCSNLSVSLQNHNSCQHQSSSEASLSQRLSHQDRHEDGCPAEQRAARWLHSAGNRPASVCYRLPPSFLSREK